MTESVDRRADATRLQIMQAAAGQFARKPYSVVNLDDILADAAVTKGAMYFHFRSKHALASAIVEDRIETGRLTAADVLARRLSGVETMVDIFYLVAVDDIGDEMARAGFNLIESIGRADGLALRVLDAWISGFADIARRAIAEGDVLDGCDPDDMARLLVSMYLGIRQTSTLDDPERFLRDLERAWTLLLPGFIKPDRLGYLRQFIKRRTTLATKKATPVRTDSL